MDQHKALMAKCKNIAVQVGITKFTIIILITLKGKESSRGAYLEKIKSRQETCVHVLQCKSQ